MIATIDNGVSSNKISDNVPVTGPQKPNRLTQITDNVCNRRDNGMLTGANFTDTISKYYFQSLHVLYELDAGKRASKINILS